MLSLVEKVKGLVKLPNPASVAALTNKAYRASGLRLESTTDIVSSSGQQFYKLLINNSIRSLCNRNIP